MAKEMVGYKLLIWSSSLKVKSTFEEGRINQFISSCDIEIPIAYPGKSVSCLNTSRKFVHSESKRITAVIYPIAWLLILEVFVLLSDCK